MPRRLWGLRRLLRMPLSETGDQYSIWIQDHESDDDPSTSQNNHGDLEEPLVCGDTIPSRYYSLDRRVELGEMANLFFNKLGRTTFYCTLCIYLYGDLSIYSAAVAKSVMDVVW
ncbi:hypothetical protein HF086_000300 [Spodoptera exigua]|uniref:Uncharacterized protein n=1 Tax=Spodoptera exigua TaxID=7107 RepID=A0A922M8P1_SPOEX|nr:hypothetical protein HF086_000300 [Spodoptera exigua]